MTNEPTSTMLMMQAQIRKNVCPTSEFPPYRSCM